MGRHRQSNGLIQSHMTAQWKERLARSLLRMTGKMPVPPGGRASKCRIFGEISALRIFVPLLRATAGRPYRGNLGEFTVAPASRRYSCLALTSEGRRAGLKPARNAGFRDGGLTLHVVFILVIRPVKERLLLIDHCVDHELHEACVPDARLLEHLVGFHHVSDHAFAV